MGTTLAEAKLLKYSLVLGGKEPRSAAERLLALETKFLLFEVGQERDSVLSRSPAPHLDCSGRRRAKLIGSNALTIAYKWHAPAADASGPRRPDEPTLTQGMVCWIDGRVKPSWRTAWSVGPTERVRRPAPWLWLVAGRSDPLRVLRIQEKALGTTRRQVLSSLDCLFLDQ